MHTPFRLGLLLIVFATRTLVAAPADNRPDQVRPVPPPGVEIPESTRQELQSRLDQLGQELESLRHSLTNKSALSRLLPDVAIFHNAVRYALTYREIFNPTNEIPAARALLDAGMERARLIRDGAAPWTSATGLVVRGYVSKIDGSVQPFGLVVPATYDPRSPVPYRLDAWFHGRDEKLSELNFLAARQRSAGEFAPASTFVLHLYGRFCNANRFAGEVDLFEALERVQREYPIDPNRIVVRGFSMGGAACWQFATHHAGRWAAAAPGAGFSETAEFLKVFQNELVQPAWWEQKLWHWYDSTDYAVNLFNCPTVAYSGEVDRQKQAADAMAQALAAEGMTLTHIVGPNTPHRYHPDSKAEINRRIDAIAARGRDPLPRRVRFTTWTLRYNEMLWVKVDALNRHWERARVDAEILDAATIKVSAENVSALSFEMPPGLCPLDSTRRPRVILDGNEVAGPPVLSDRSWSASFTKTDGAWRASSPAAEAGLRKRHGLQGPIDDAFMDRFLMVHPTGAPLNEKLAAWTHSEERHAIEHWRRQFRGEAPIKDDTDISDDDIASSNLILWGDPGSNAVLARIASRLPLRWDPTGVHSGDAIYPTDRYAPVLIYPNPLNPKRYVVLNSGFTFREYDYLNNARQTAKLPDYAIIDFSVPPSSRAPGGIAVAGFFDEQWQLPR